MAKVIDLSDRKKLKDDISRAEKLEGLQSLLRCNHCGLRCAKCQSHAERISSVDHPGSGITIRLCPACLDEYTDLLAYLDAEKHDDFPAWYNREWVRQWLSWLDYQWALKNYVSSPEVLMVLSELKED